MIIVQKHPYVDYTGKCSFPYITQWNPNQHLLGKIKEK